ncbi:MAG: tyrosine-type recombinase/integrase [Spirochaetaceae bacterium]|jgi:integrase/recombinase XerD|nr:tyrosine-type recombinase/integrase [Spirochaetaceae bacterium]
MEAQTILTQYYDRLIRQKRRSPLTAETYRYEVRRFLAWLEAERESLETVDFRGLIRYMDQRREADGVGSRSAAKAVTVLRSFFQFLLGEGIRSDNPSALIESPRRQIRLPSALDPESVERLLGLIDTGTPLGVRDRTLYELLYETGLRVSEASGLNLPDLMFSERLLRVRGKGNKERLVIFGDASAQWLKRYLKEARPRIARVAASPAVFIGRTGRRLSRKGIWKNYAVFAENAGVSSKLHALRHTFATELLRGGADLRSVQELLGHTNLSTTQWYVHVDLSLLQESHLRYMPVLREFADD